MAETTELERLLRASEQKAKEAREDFNKDTPTFFKRVKARLGKIVSSIRAWFDRPIRILEVVLLVGNLVLLSALFVNKEKSSFNVTMEKAPIETLIPIKEKKVEDKKVRYAAINIDGKVVSIDLSKLKLTKTVATTNLKNKKKMIGVSYSLEMGMKDRKGSSVYLTIYEDEDSLLLTKEFENILTEDKKQSK